MSTFKVQPIYAELLMGWLDAAHLEVADLTFARVLNAVQWRFKGGKLGDYSMKYPTECSETRFPDGTTRELAAADAYDVNYMALESLVRRRVRDRRKRARGCADWACSFFTSQAVCYGVGSTEPMPTGMRAVYRVLLDIWENCYVPPRSTAADKLRTYVREVTLASSAASHLDVPTTAELIENVFSALSRTRMHAIRHAAAEFDSMLRYTGSASARATSVRVGRLIMADSKAVSKMLPTELGARPMSVASRKYYASHGCAFVAIAGVVHALSRSDLLRVHQFLAGVQSGLFATVTQACIAPGPERVRASEIGNIYEAQVQRLLEPAGTVPQGDEVAVCKAYKRAFGAYIGELAGPLCADETRELWIEALSTKSAGGLALPDWVNCLRGWSASTAFNLGKVYKLCPAPDASPGLTMIERHEKVCNHNTFDHTEAEAFENEYRAQVLRAYIRRPGVKLEVRGDKPKWFSAYKDGRFDEIPSAEIHTYLKWEGTATMPVRSPDDPAVWKDSGLGWDDYDTAIDPDRVPKHGNMLTRMVFDSSCPMPGVRYSGHAHEHKMDIKPEGHKDPARGIYSGNIKDRLNQSWMEAAVHEVAVGHPAFMVGASSETRDNRVRAIVERSHNPDEVSLYYSFDVSGWSPNMPPEVQHISHRVWGELYDESLFHLAHLITDNTRVYMNKQGYTCWFVNPGANFEGYNGKEMTMILITLMSMAVQDWRAAVTRSGLATAEESQKWSATLLAYIDDGLAKINLPLDRSERLFAELKACAEARFSRMGFTIEPSKCYPSDRFAVFLNEPYLAGRHVTHGTRAAMTICAENTEEHTSLVERLTSVSTGCRGAVMSGLDGTAGTMLQAYHTYGHLSEWIRKPDPVVAALWTMMPRAWGGLGMPTSLQLGTSGSGSAFEESVRTMQRWAQISTTARVAFLARAKSALKARTATGILMAPLGGRTGGGTMVETRIPDAVRKALTALRANGKLSRLATDFLGYSSPESLEAFAAAIVRLEPKQVIQEQLLADLSSAHPHSIFSSFARRIEKSTTLMQLIGHKEVRRIIKGNRDDASESYRLAREVLMF